MMEKKLASLLCLVSMLVVGTLVFFTNKTIDFSTLFLAFKLMIPTGVVGYVFGILLGKILLTSKSDTNLIHSKAHQKFVDDLLLSPEQIITSASFIKSKTSTTDDKEDNLTQ